MPIRALPGTLIALALAAAVIGGASARAESPRVPATAARTLPMTEVLPPEAPLIQRQPVSRGAFVGSSVTFSVRATPSPLDPAGTNAVLSYAWFFSTNNTAGSAGSDRRPITPGVFDFVTNAALPELVLTNVLPTNSLFYWAVVTSTSGTNTYAARSLPAELRVVPGFASQLRLENGVATNIAAVGDDGILKSADRAGGNGGRNPATTRFSIPLVIAAAGNERAVQATFGYDPAVLSGPRFEADTNVFNTATASNILQWTEPGRFAFVASLLTNAGVGFPLLGRIGWLAFDMPSADVVGTLSRSALRVITDLPATNIAPPFLPLPTSASRSQGTDFSVVTNFPLNVLVTPQVVPAGTPTLDRQTGYWVQRLDVVNPGPTALEDSRLVVGGLTNDSRGVAVGLASAVGTLGVPARPFVFLGPLAAYGARRFSLEYYVSDGLASSIGTPVYVAEPAADSSAAPPAGRRSITPTLVTNVAAGLLIQFPTLTNFSYYVRYSDRLSDFDAMSTNVTDIRTARPEIAGIGRPVQWVDNGPPRTDSAPGTNRFYRVLEFR